MSRENGREKILESARDRPWLTHAELADELGLARSWVSEVLGESEEVEAIREAYRSGITIHPETAAEMHSATALLRTLGVGEGVIDRLNRSVEADDETIESVLIRFEITVHD